MRVVFLSDVDGVAYAGDVKNVADGYARNFLLPRGLAAAATANYLQQAESRARKIAAEQEKIDAAAREVATKIEAAPLVIEARVGEQGRLYGSVTATDIAERLAELTGHAIEHRHVHLGQPIKEIGRFEMNVVLSRNVRASVTVDVAADAESQAAEAAATQE
jgi:large subunit ribosomal protein L9